MKSKKEETRRVAVLALIASLVLLLGASAKAEDRGFRYEVSSRKCVDSDGKTGLNPGYPGECGDLRGQDLRYLSERPDLLRMSMRGSVLAGADLRGLNLSGFDFTDAAMNGARLDGAQMVKATFTRAKLRDASFQKADISNCGFEWADLQRADLSGAHIERSSFARSWLAHAKFNYAFIDDTDFSGSVLSFAGFPGANLSRVRFNEIKGNGTAFPEAKIVGASFILARLRNANFERALFLESIGTEGAPTTQNRFDHAYLYDARFGNASLGPAVFYLADLTGADLQGTHASTAWIKTAKLNAALFDEDTILPFDRLTAWEKGMVFAR